MNTTTVSKTDFIKFNVSPTFKMLAQRKALEHGMTISELGRMLFGAFVSGIAKPNYEISEEFMKMAEEAKRDHEQGKGILIKSRKELESFLDSL